MHRRAAAALLAVVTLGSLGACGGDGDDEPQSVPTTQAAGGGCELVTHEEMTDLLGRTLAPAKDTSQGVNLGCAWQSSEPATPDDVVFATLTLRPDKGNTYAGTVEATKARAQKIEPVEGVGDEATFFITTAAQASAFQLLTRQGAVLTFITIAGRIDEAKAKSVAIAALQQVLDRYEPSPPPTP